MNEIQDIKFDLPTGIAYTPMSWYRFETVHKEAKDKDHQRYGQRFWNMFVMPTAPYESCPDLFHETSDGRAREMVRQILTQNGYSGGLMPPTVEQVKQYMLSRDTAPSFE
jgi:hypothetical protein